MRESASHTVHSFSDTYKVSPNSAIHKIVFVRDFLYQMTSNLLVIRIGYHNLLLDMTTLLTLLKEQTHTVRRLDSSETNQQLSLSL